MGYAMAFLDAAGSDPKGPFAALAATPERRRQFQYAALLHDIGKIGVPEHILTKEGRLSTAQFAVLMARLDLVEFALKYAPVMVSWQSAAEAADDRAFLTRINTAGRLADEDIRRLEQLRRKYFQSADGRKTDFFSDAELHSLSVRAGNLTAEERELINSHASATFRILSKIPWTRQLEMIPTIAAMHHEKMDGSGYPYGLKSEDICLESRVLAVIDIYEALVAQDRPYKPKMAPEKAMEIIDKEVAANHLDPEVVRFFKEKGIYRLFTDQNKT
jgi:response regulator RpfG family c-di-GMP phosphodiesterase